MHHTILHTILFSSVMFPEIFPLGLETFSQLIFEDDYGAVRYYENISNVRGLHGIFQANLFFSRRKASTQHRSATSPDFRIGASCWTPLGIFCRSKSSWQTWWACITFVVILLFQLCSLTVCLRRKPWRWTKLMCSTGTLWTIRPFLTWAKRSRSWASRSAPGFVFYSFMLSCFHLLSLFFVGVLTGSVPPVLTRVHALWCEDGDWICPSERHSCHPRVWHAGTHSVLGQRWVWHNQNAEVTWQMHQLQPLVSIRPGRSAHTLLLRITTLWLLWTGEPHPEHHLHIHDTVL